MPHAFRLEQHLTSAELLDLCKYVALRIRRIYHGQVGLDDAVGWAGVGISIAATKFDASKLTGDVETDRKAIFNWHRNKGKWCAIDEMRRNRVVDREVNGKLVRRLVNARNASDTPANVADKRLMNPLERADERAHDPSDQLTARDFYEWSSGQVSFIQREVLYYYYIAKVPLKTIGRVLGLTEPRVSQIHNESLRHLRGLV